MSVTSERAGKVSLVLAVMGLLFIAVAAVTLLAQDRYLGQTYGGLIASTIVLIACCALFILLQAVALVYGVVGRKTAAGKIGLWIAGLSFALPLALLILPAW